MKLKSALAFLLLIPVLSSNAQKAIICKEDSLKIGNERLPGISVIIPEVDYATTVADWIKLLQSGTKSKVVTENGEMTIFGAILKDVTEYPQINVYSKLLDRDSVLYLGVVFELKKDQYIERATGEPDLARAKTFLFNFAKKQYIRLAEDQLKAEEKNFKEMEKELGSLQKDETGMERSIRSYEKNLTTEKDNLNSLNNDLISLSAAIEQHRGDLAKLSTGTEKDEKVAYIKDLDKQKKKTLKYVTKTENRISKYQKEIEKVRSSIPKNDKIQVKFQEQIDQQEANVQKYTDKVNLIKEFR
ncbi:MAG: hypothetical protein NT092_01745 [Bacteroidia bacterium]|nr:hypothetical protein [Bacteroidia bacterium]